MTTRLLAIYLAVTLHMFLNPALRPMDAQASPVLPSSSLVTQNAA